MPTSIKPITLAVSGTLTETGAGPNGTDAKVIYQKCGAGFGNLIGNGSYNMQRRAYVKPTNTVTPPLAARRALMAAAVAAWKLTTPTEREAWRHIGARRNLPAYNAFLSDYLSGNIADEWDHGGTGWDFTTPATWDTDPATWDAGATTWDTGETAWDVQATAWDNGATTWDYYPLTHWFN